MIKLDQKIISLEQSFSDSIITPVHDVFLQAHGVELWLKRDDLLHPIISGNKWRKLKYIVNHALSCQAQRLVSMGGAYSNHLHALAFVAKQLGLASTGIIRGERPQRLNPTLNDLQDWGMTLDFVSRSEFRDLRAYKHFDDQPGQDYQGYWLAEGGACVLAMQGIAELADELTTETAPTFTCVFVPCGTGTTMAGLVATLTDIDKLIGFAALKGAGFLTADINALLRQSHQLAQVEWTINLDYHFGGFARSNQQLLAFIKDFGENTGIALDPVYTGKMLYGIYDLIRQGKIAAGQRVLAVHTGGLQGAREFLI